MSATTLQRELEAKRGLLPGSVETERLREERLGTFAARGFPTTRDENWRYTDLKAVAGGSFDFVPARPDAAAIAAVRALLAQSAEPIGPRLVFVDGELVAELSTATRETDGVVVLALADHWERFEAERWRRLDSSGHPLAVLNSAFVRHGAWIRVADGAQLEAPLEIVFAGSGRAGLAVHPRVSIEVGHDARITVIERFVDHGEPANWLNPVTEITQARSSHATVYRMQQHGAAQFHTSLLHAELAKEAALKVGYVDLGGNLTRNDIDVKLLEPGASTEIFGVFLAAGQHVDNHTLIDHLAAETLSDEAFRGIIGRRGRGVFNGRVVVHRNAQRIAASQRNDNLLLAENAEIDTKPELEIYADDVKCSHGSTVGELDSEHLFYLRSRGIDDQAARSLLTLAFAETVLERIRLPALREAAVAAVAERLSAWGMSR